MKRFYTFLIFIILNIIIFYVIDLRAKKSFKKYLDLNITGIIDSIYYDEKTITTVIINDEKYYLGYFNIRKRDDLKKGDSIYKRGGSKLLELHSKTTNGKFIYTQDFTMSK